MLSLCHMITNNASEMKIEKFINSIVDFYDGMLYWPPFRLVYLKQDYIFTFYMACFSFYDFTFTTIWLLTFMRMRCFIEYLF